MQRTLWILLSVLPFIVSAQTNLKMNDIQVIGSHNSYKTGIDAPLMMQLMAHDSNQAKALDYGHLALAEQLDLGLRTLEIDIFYDPNGGLFSQPVGLQEQIKIGLSPQLLDSSIYAKPGFKVLHVQDIDFRTSCATLQLCLAEILQWSSTHPKHLPIMISFNAKEQVIAERPDFAVPLPFTSQAFDALDAEILTAIPRQMIITPDDIKGQHTNVRAAVLEDGWPKLDDSRGKVFFVLDAGSGQTDVYQEDHAGLKDRVMFATLPKEDPAAAILFMNDPISAQEDIQSAVAEGFLVRTRADADTYEARMGDYTKFEAAKSSGAHFISTDYYKVDPRLGTGYQVKFDKLMFRCNPLRAAKECDTMKLE